MTNTSIPNSLSFEICADGSVKMEIADREGGCTIYTYLAEKPQELAHEGQIYRTRKGVNIQVGIVLNEDGTGRGVAWRNTENVVTDAELEEWKTGASIGRCKSVPALIPLTPAQRWTVMQEANLRMAYAPGWNLSGAVSQASNDIKRGQTPCLDRWTAEMAQRKA